MLSGKVQQHNAKNPSSQISFFTRNLATVEKPVRERAFKFLKVIAHTTDGPIPIGFQPEQQGISSKPLNQGTLPSFSNWKGGHWGSSNIF
jgi:hypothetical protein